MRPSLLGGQCNGEDHITPGPAALRDFNPAYVGSGSKVALRPCRLQCPVCPKAVIERTSVHCPRHCNSGDWPSFAPQETMEYPARSLRLDVGCLNDGRPARNFVFQKHSQCLLTASRFFRKIVGQFDQALTRAFVIERPI